MKRLRFLLVMVLGLSAQIYSQQVQEIGVNQLLKRVNQDNDSVYVVNFWATWCHPCVEELPIFDANELHQEHNNLKVILVSLDFVSQKEKQLIPFIREQQLQQEVVLLNERNPNDWVNLINPAWSGAIPATFVYSNQSSVFHEGELSLPELMDLIASIHQ